MRIFSVTGAVFFLFFGASAWGRIDTVRVEDFSFIPASKTIQAGDTIRWRVFEQCCLDHTVTRGDPPMSWDSGPLYLGDVYQLAFPDTGVFDYGCFNHEYIGMIGSITVEPRPPAPAVSATGRVGLVLLLASLAAAAIWILERRRKTA